MLGQLVLLEPASPGGMPAPAILRSQFVSPAVSQAKFDQEVVIFRSREEAQRRRGILLLKAEFPYVLLAFMAPRAKPTPLAFGVRVDFTNYDVEPLSIQFVDPFQEKLLRTHELPVQFTRFKPGKPAGPNGEPPIPPEHEGFLVSYAPDDFPFLCLPGVYEYHAHNAHTGNNWLLHRGTGAGRLGHLIESMYKYGIEGIGGFTPQFSVGFNGVNQVVVNLERFQLHYDHHPE